MRVCDALDRFLERHEFPVYAALFLAALLVRLLAIAGSPLSTREAVEAWGAIDVLRGGTGESSSALFASLTAGLLFIAGPSHWAPRLFPAMAGAFAVLLPLWGKESRGRIESFLLAFLLALSPSLWIASTMAGGTALGFLAAGFFLFYVRRKNSNPLVSGLALGLAIASGPTGWSGLVIAAIVPLVERIFSSRDAQTHLESADHRPAMTSPHAIAGFILGAAAGSTGLFFFPREIGALAAGFTGWLNAFFSGWPRLGEFILLLVGYEPVALVFGAAGLYLLWKGAPTAENRFWGMFAAVAAIWVLIRPAAFPDEALWVILPLLVLGARALRAALESSELQERPQFVLLQAGAVLALAAFAVFNLAAATSVSTGSVLYVLLALAGILGGFLPGLLYSDGLGAAFRASWAGLALAWFAFFSFTQAGAGWNATHIRRVSANELWQTEAVAWDALRLHGTMVQISEWQTGEKGELAATILLPEESALGWELLTYRAAEYRDALDMLAVPPMLIAPLVEVDGAAVAPQLTVVYRGQAFGYTERRAWSGWPPDLIRWLLFREGPVERVRVILWVRSDILVPEEGARE